MSDPNQRVEDSGFILGSPYTHYESIGAAGLSYVSSPEQHEQSNINKTASMATADEVQ